MKKASFVMLFLLLPFVTQAALVEDFELYATGNVVTVASPPWYRLTGDANNEVPVIAAETGGNQYQNAAGAYRSLGSNSIANASTATTVFFRLYKPAANNPDWSIGLTDVATPGNNWSDFECQVAVGGTTLSARNAGSTTSLMTITNDTWYNIWLVVNNSANTYDVYVTTGSADATSSDKKTATPFTFRNGAATNDLVTFKVYGRSSATTPYRSCQVDDVHVISGGNLSYPVNPRPYGPSVEEVTPTAVVLHWKAGRDTAGTYAVNPDIVDQYVFMSNGTTSTPYYMGATGDPGTADPNSRYPGTGTIITEMNKTYYWTVVEAMAGYAQTLTPGVSTLADVNANNIIGKTRTYIAPKTVPVITSQPVNVVVEPNAPNVPFTVKFYSDSAPTAINWYKVGSATPLPNGAKYVITTEPNGIYYTTNLQVLQLGLADIGSYYCTLENASTGGTPVVSGSASLEIKRLVAHYPFNGNADDTAGTVNGTVMYTSPLPPSYVTGLPNLNQAIEFNGTNQYVRLPATTYPKPGVGGAFEAGTVSCWVRINAYTSDMRILGCDQGQQYEVWVDNSSGMISFALDSNGGTNQISLSATPSSNWIGDGRWHLITVTYEKGVGGQMYLDAAAAGTADTTYSDTTFVTWTYGMGIGAGLNSSGVAYQYFNGSVDDVRIYNYPLSLAKIQTLYLDAGLVLCLNPYASQYDINKNCQIDLADIVMFAAKWLSCGRDPVETCD